MSPPAKPSLGALPCLHWSTELTDATIIHEVASRIDHQRGLNSPEAWNQLPDAPITLGKYGIWTGQELLAGTEGCCGSLGTNDLVGYTPAANSWQALSPFPDSVRGDFAVVWTGTQMLVAGGSGSTSPDNNDPRDDNVPLSDGASYNPTTNTWQPIAPMPQPVSVAQGSIWTGHEFLVFDGTGTQAYNPATNSWRTLAPAPFSRTGSFVAWTGTEMLVWGGTQTSDPTSVHADGAALNPKTNSWRPIPSAPVPARSSGSGVWSGTEMIIWGGQDTTNSQQFGQGAAYNPTTNTWRALPASPLRARTGNQAIWTGYEMLIFNGEGDAPNPSDGGLFTDGAAYNPATNSWRSLLPDPANVYGSRQTVWTGNTAIFSGGAPEPLQGPGQAAIAYIP